MAHVTFIHGIANKPAPELLLETWLNDIADGGFDLGTKGVTSSLVYWADMMYEQPAHSDAGFESVDAALGTLATDESTQWVQDLPAPERAFAESLIHKIGLDKEPPGGDRHAMPEADLTEQEARQFEAIPLPWFIKERVMKRFLKDVHHYLFNASFSPRAGETYEVRTDIRKRFVKQLVTDKANAGPHIVVSHSMGTVISYDCLKNVPECPAIDGYMTVGSPLGLSEIHDNFTPDYDKRSAFPRSRLTGSWLNLYDRLDPVAFDSNLANDYQERGHEVINDIRVRNPGRWRHDSSKYFRQAVFGEHLQQLLAN